MKTEVGKPFYQEICGLPSWRNQLGLVAHWSHNYEWNTLVKLEKNKRVMKKIQATAVREKKGK
jgi:hypothetical protein